MKVQNLINALFSEHGVIREAAARALGNIGPGAKAAVPALVRALKDDEPAVFFESEAALIKIGPQAVSTLAEMLENKHEDKALRMIAVKILGKIGFWALPALIKALAGPESDVRWGAAYALADIAPEAKLPAVLSLVEVLNDDRKWVREYAAWVLETMNTTEARKTLEEYRQKSN